MSTNQLNHNKFRFILLRGVLGWGIPTAIIFHLIIFPISGIFFGYFLWKAKSRKLLKQ